MSDLSRVVFYIGEMSAKRRAFRKSVSKSVAFADNDEVLASIDAGGKTTLIIGENPYSDMTLEKAVYWKILRHQLLVTGTWNSSFCFPEDEAAEPDDWRYVLKKLEEKKISPADFITHRFSLENLEQGFHIMRDKSEDYVKVMGVFE